MYDRALALALITAALTACGPAAYEIRNESSQPTPSDAEAYVEASLAWWGADAAALDGWKIVLRDEVLCGAFMAPTTGCTTWTSKTIEVVIVPAACAVPAMEDLAHEIGHAVLGPPSGRHEDPRWHERDVMLATVTSEVCQ